MKKTLLAAVALATVALTSSFAKAEQVFIAQTGLSTYMDYDAVPASQACGLTAVQVQVFGGSAHIEYLDVRFGNGESQMLHVRENFAKNTKSRWIDLNGTKRCINRIRVLGRSTDYNPRDTVVRLVGKKPAPAYNHPGGIMWLGATELMNSADADSFSLTGACNNLKSIKIVATYGAAEIYYLSIQFGNGDNQTLEVRQFFNQGGESRWIDLKGGARCVRKITVVGRSNDYRPGQTRIDFYGQTNYR